MLCFILKKKKKNLKVRYCDLIIILINIEVIYFGFFIIYFYEIYCDLYTIKVVLLKSPCKNDVLTAYSCEVFCLEHYFLNN